MKILILAAVCVLTGMSTPAEAQLYYRERPPRFYVPPKAPVVLIYRQSEHYYDSQYGLVYEVPEYSYVGPYHSPVPQMYVLSRPPVVYVRPPHRHRHHHRR